MPPQQPALENQKSAPQWPVVQRQGRNRTHRHQALSRFHPPDLSTTEHGPADQPAGFLSRRRPLLQVSLRSDIGNRLQPLPHPCFATSKPISLTCHPSAGGSWCVALLQPPAWNLGEIPANPVPWPIVFPKTCVIPLASSPTRSPALQPRPPKLQPCCGRRPLAERQGRWRIGEKLAC